MSFLRRQTAATRPSPQLVEAEAALAAHLLHDGDSLRAWNAVWDLINSSDSQAKQHVINSLRSYTDTPAANDTSVRAQEFSDAIDGSMRSRSTSKQLLPSEEVRDQGTADRVEAHQKAMRDAGVRYGEGLPMWMMYMTRRNKRSWG